MSTSNRMHGEFLRLLFLQAHRETEAHFTAAGMPFRFKRAAFYQGLKSKVGLAAAKAAALRINLNVQGCGIVLTPMHAPSRTPLLLPLLLSHNLPIPRVHLCVLGRLVHAGLGSSSLVAHVLHYPLPPHANSFVIGPAVIKHTHARTVRSVRPAGLARTVRRTGGGVRYPGTAQTPDPPRPAPACSGRHHSAKVRFPVWNRIFSVCMVLWNSGFMVSWTFGCSDSIGTSGKQKIAVCAFLRVVWFFGDFLSRMACW